MLVKDLVTETPKVLLLFRCFFFRFRLFRLLVRRGSLSKRLEFLAVFFAWSLAIFAASNVVVEALTGKKILALSGQLERILIIHNGVVRDFGGQDRPFVIQLLGNELGWRFDLGFTQLSAYAQPVGLQPDLELACMLVDDQPDLAWPEAEVRAKFAEYQQLMAPDCRTDPRGYFLLLRRQQIVMSESNLPLGSSHWALPPLDAEPPQGIIAIPDRTCFANGLYAACFDYLDATGLSAPAAFVLLLVFALTYASSFAGVDRAWFKVGFVDSMLSFLVLNMTFIVLAGLVLLLAVAGGRLLQFDASWLAAAAVLGLSAFFLYRAGLMFGHATAPPWWQRGVALALGLLVSWSLAGVVFLPLQIGLILFHDVISGLL